MEERFETQVPARSTAPMWTDGQPSRALGERRFEISSGTAIVLTPLLPKLFRLADGKQPHGMESHVPDRALERSGAKEQNREPRECAVSESIV